MYGSLYSTVNNGPQYITTGIREVRHSLIAVRRCSGHSRGCGRSVVVQSNARSRRARSLAPGNSRASSWADSPSGLVPAVSPLPPDARPQQPADGRSPPLNGDERTRGTRRGEETCASLPEGVRGDVQRKPVDCYGRGHIHEAAFPFAEMAMVSPTDF